MIELDRAVSALRQSLFAGGDHGPAFDAVIAAGRVAGLDANDRAISALLCRDSRRASAGRSPSLVVASGALVENGGTPLESIDAVLDALRAATNALLTAGSALEGVDLDRGNAPAGLGELALAWVPAFRRLVIGAMARLARSVPARQRARAHRELDTGMRRLAELCEGWHIRYILAILDMLDDTPLLLVETETGAITRYRATGIRNNFHLITLLEGLDPFELAARRDQLVRASRGYYNWGYLGITSNLARDVIQTMIPGDARATDLPQFEGTRVVVRTPTGVQRSWDFAFVAPIHDALRSTLEVEQVLTASEARALLECMAAAGIPSALGDADAMRDSRARAPATLRFLTTRSSCSDQFARARAVLGVTRCIVAGSS